MTFSASARRSATQSVRRTSAAGRRTLATERPIPRKHYPSITPPYDVLQEKLMRVRSILTRPLSLAEKILYSHLHEVESLAEFASGGNGKVRGDAFLRLKPDRVAMQGALLSH